MTNRSPSRRASRSWDPVAHWYAGWTGTHGSRHHTALAIPLAMELLALSPGEAVIDLGCGPGVTAPSIAATGARLTGIDLSPRLIEVARRNHRAHGSFQVGDVTRLKALPGLRPASFDAALFLLSIQDIEPLADAVAAASWVLKPRGRLAIVMLHPCFRVPRQSGWGWDEKRGLQFRRLDSYLTRLAVPMQAYPGGGGTTRSFHRPLAEYMSALARAGFVLTDLREVPGLEHRSAGRAERRAAREIPLMLGIRAALK